eukprot:989391-Rhodomonas_salina.3
MSQTLVPAPSLCASQVGAHRQPTVPSQFFSRAKECKPDCSFFRVQDDMYDTASRLCQVGNKYAYWYLRNKNWVQ